jgi:RNase P subunit RPR2
MPTITGLKDKAERAERAAGEWEAMAKRYRGGVFLRQEAADDAEREAETAMAEASAWRAIAKNCRRLMEKCRHASLLAESGEGSLKVTCIDCGKTETVSGPNQELTMGVFAGRKYDEFRWPW